MKDNSILKDERTVAVENASYRGVVRQESGWDLMALVILSSLIATFYQRSQKILGRRWILLAVITAVLAATVTIVFVLIK